jgi:hypothetical protein
MHAVGRDLLAAAFGLAAAALWTHLFVRLVRTRRLASAVSRKAVHVTTGPLFFLTLPLYSARPAARCLAAAVPALFAARLLLAARGITADGLAEAVARGGGGLSGGAGGRKSRHSADVDSDKRHDRSRSSSFSSISSSGSGARSGSAGHSRSSSASSISRDGGDRAGLLDKNGGRADSRNHNGDTLARPVGVGVADGDMAAAKTAAAAAVAAANAAVAARREAAGGPFWYAIAVSAATLGGWRTARAAAVAVAMLAFGDGCAEVGAWQPLAAWPLPAGWKRKSVGGSLAFVAAGATGAMALTAYLSAAGVFA